MAEMTTYGDRLAAAWADHLALRALDAPTVVSTFAGCGGSSLGYSMAGYRELLAVEWNDHAVATFRANFPGVPVHHGDIAALSVDECLRTIGLAPGELDVLDGSPPCQGFSMAGQRVLDDPRNELFRQYVRLLDGLRPRAFVMENVGGMVRGKMKLVFADCLRALKACGYRVSARLLNAMYFGVPQARQRMIFVGVRADLGRDPSHPAAAERPISVRQALPWIDGIDGRVDSQFRRRDLDLDRPFNTVVASDPVHTRYQVRDHAYGTFTSGFSAGEIVSFDKPAPTVMKGGIGGSGPYQFAVTNGREARRLQIDEVKTLCSFPPQFQMTGTYAEQWAVLGNCVPPLFMRAVAEHIRSTILPAALAGAAD